MTAARTRGARALAASVAALALAAVAPGAAEAAGWDVKVDISGGGAVEVEGHRSESSFTRHFTTTIGSHPFGRTVWLEAKPHWWSDRDAVWSDCNVTEGNRCRIDLGLVVPTPWDPVTVKHRAISVHFPDSDVDNDGYPRSDDCDDHNAKINKGAFDVPGNGVDEDCDGKDADSLDRDGDGSNRPADCNDDDPKIHPNARDIPRNGIDDDCKDGDSLDGDGDGYNHPAPRQVEDCNDEVSGIHPGAVDVPRNGVDEDCHDGDNRDADKDGYKHPPDRGQARDCDDANAARHPDAFDHPDNGVDENCDGRDDERPDRDGDGYSRPADCRDNDPNIHPGARDKPRNGIDEDCDGRDADYPAIASDIVHGERGAGRFTKLYRLAVTTPPAGTTVTLKCKGKGCRFKTRTVRAVPGMKSLSLAKHFRKKKLAPGARVEVAVRAPETYGKILRLKIRNGAQPKVTWLKIDPVSGAVTPW